MLTVKVLGFGCFNCQRLEQETRAALAEMTPNIPYEIIKVSDDKQIVGWACKLIAG